MQTEKIVCASIAAWRETLRLTVNAWFHLGVRDRMPGCNPCKLSILGEFCGRPPVLPWYDAEIVRRHMSVEASPPSVRECLICGKTHRTSDDCPVQDQTLRDQSHAEDPFKRPYGSKLQDAELMRGMVTL